MKDTFYNTISDTPFFWDVDTESYNGTLKISG